MAQEGNGVVAEEHDPLTRTWKASDLGITFEDDAPTAVAASVSPPPNAPTARAVGVAARPGIAARRPPQILIEPKVVVASDLDATLPPRDQRQLLEAAHESHAPLVAESESAQSIRPRLWSVISIVALFAGAVAYGVASGLLDPERADAREPAPFFPEHLHTASSGAPASPPVAPSAGHSQGLPPELAATLAQALPVAPTPTPAPNASDAGVPALDPAPAAISAPAPAEPRVAVVTEAPSPSGQPHGAATLPSSPDNQRRANALQASLERRRSASKPSSAPRAPSPPALPSHAPEPAPAPASALLQPALPTALEAGLGASLPEISAAPADVQAAAEPRSSAPSVVQSPGPASVRPLMTYTYAARELFTVATARERVTDIVLQDGEKLLARPNAGDASRWTISVLESGPQVHVFVRPLRSGLKTNLTITTDRRSYFLEMSSADGSPYMAGVQWRYPADDAARRRTELQLAEHERSSTTSVSAVDALRFDYRISVAQGEPRWKPLQVFDDGVRTFIRFPRPLGAQGPALFLPQTRTQRAAYLNYRIRGDLYVLDRLVDAAELRMSAPDSDDGGQEIVRIVRRLGR